MLTKRTNILFDEKMFASLIFLAKRRKTSIGGLVRKAVAQTYFGSKDNQERMALFKEICQLKKGLGRLQNKEIKSLINYGRKY